MDTQVCIYNFPHIYVFKFDNQGEYEGGHRFCEQILMKGNY